MRQTHRAHRTQASFFADAGSIWVTGRIEEEFEESCLLPKFKKQEAIVVWTCFVGRRKCQLIWDKAEWGRTITAKEYQTHILPELDQFWNDESACTQDYSYIQQENASRYRVCTIVAHLQDCGLYNYLLPWSAILPDLNPIEAIWRLMKSQIGKLHSQPLNNILN